MARNLPRKDAPDHSEKPQEQLPSDPLREEISERLGPLVPRDKRQVLVDTAVSIYSEMFAGPIAHPRHLAEYERILPGAAERIVAMAERQQAHNIDVNSRTLQAAIADEKRGMQYGAGILVLCIAAAFVAGTFFANTVLAGIFLAGAVLSAIGQFVTRRG